MKTINIYIKHAQKQHADRIRDKYKISLSTLVGKCAFNLANVLLKSSNKNTLEYLQQNYLQSPKEVYKTSVKPKELNEVLGGMENKNIFATNSLVIYLEKKINDYVSKEWANKFYADMDKDLKNAYDVYWDYNSLIRNQRRMFRSNKKYWKKVLEEME